MTRLRTGNGNADREIEKYIDEHLTRFVRTLEAIPDGAGTGKLLDAGGLVNLVPCYLDLLNYRHVTTASKREESLFAAGKLKRRLRELGDARLSYFDLEFDRFPFADSTFDTVVCCEVIEHNDRQPDGAGLGA